MIGTIYDKPLSVNFTFDPVALAELNRAWIHNATQLGYISLAIGFLIGAGSVYLYFWRRDHDWDRTYGPR
jgi:hypothetical protein